MKTKKLPLLSSTLRKIHQLLWFAFIILTTGGFYLALITFSEWLSGNILQGMFYQWIFLSHLFVGIITIPILVYFISDHFRRGWNRPNRRVVYIGVTVALSSLVVALTGFFLIRLEDFVTTSGFGREIAYWLHVVIPVALIYLYRLHRKIGKPMDKNHLHSRVKIVVAAVTLIVIFHFGQLFWQKTDYIKPFSPSLVEVVDGEQIRSSDLLIDDYCKECHEDVVERWQHSAHHLSSLNNPIYDFSINNTKKALEQIQGHSKNAQFCAGCHDPVLLLTEQFDSDKFVKGTAEAEAGINCLSCHSIQGVSGRRGNANYQFKLPQHYPFAFSDSDSLRWLSRQLVRAKPELHKRSFLKPVHKTTEFCGVCHKVSIPRVVNQYRWLRGQNHFDEFALSGVSGLGVSSFYYPDKTHNNCNACHMKPIDSDDPAATQLSDSSANQIHDHLYPSGNTALQLFQTMPEKILDERVAELTDVVRLDIFGFRENAQIDGKLIGPELDKFKSLKPGKEYLLEIVIRTTGMGHMLTGGTVDSNELWLHTQIWYQDAEGEHLLAESGSIEKETGIINEYSHFVNSYLLDRKGNKIDRRNVEDIFVPLYNHQIPPGAADVVHYKIKLPETDWTSLRVESSLNYRKFSPQLMKLAGVGDNNKGIPVVMMATDKLSISPNTASKQQIIPLWQRWNDYGIGLLRKPKKMQLKQAEQAFSQVAEMRKSDGPVNLVRVYLAEGRLDDAQQQLNKAIDMKTAKAWTLLWLKGQIEQQNGYLEQAISTFEKIIQTNFSSEERIFDFSKDYRLLNLLAKTEIEAALRYKRSDNNLYHSWLNNAKNHLLQVLKLDDENATAYFNLARVLQLQTTNLQGVELQQNKQQIKMYKELHNKYRHDEFVRGRAISIHRQNNKAADNAANDVVIYPLN